MYLIDSSAWIEFLRPSGSAKVKKIVKEILHKDEVCTCGIVTVEILRGAKNKKDYQHLYKSFTSLTQLPINDKVIGTASNWGYILDRKGKTISTTDLIIAAASFKQAYLLHIDSDFKIISNEFDLKEERLEL